MTTWAESCGLWWAEFLLSSTCLLALTLGAMVCVRKPRHRMVWLRVTSVALVVLAVLPAWSNRPRLSLGRISELTPASFPESTAIAVRQIDVAETVPVDAPNSPLPTTGISTGTARSLMMPISISAAWLRALGAVFLIGMILVGVRLLVGLRQVRRMRRMADDAPATWQAVLMEVADHGERLPQLLISRDGIDALAFGAFHPAILLPRRYVGEAPIRLKAVLAHEYAHIRHGDLWLRGLTRWLLLLLFPHPLFWWLQRRVHECQESLADAEAAEHVGTDVLVSELKRMAKIAVGAGSRRLAPLGLAMAARPSQFYLRVARLLDDGSPVETRCSSRTRIAGLLGCAACAAISALLPFRPAHSIERIADAATNLSEISAWSGSETPDNARGTANRSAHLPANASLLLPGRFERTEDPETFRISVAEPGPVSIFIIPVGEQIHPMIRAEWTTASGQTDSDSDSGGGSRRGDRPMIMIPFIPAAPANHVLISAHARESGPTFLAGDYLLFIRHGRSALDLDPETVGVEASTILLNRTGEGYLSHDPIDGKRGPAIDYPGDADVFQIVAARSGPITFAARGDSGLRLALRLICTAPRYEAEDVGGGIAGASRITRETHAGTLFYIEVVAADGSSTGPYSVQISQ